MFETKTEIMVARKVLAKMDPRVRQFLCSI